MKKRIFSALMALCLAFSISGAAFADDATAGAGQSASQTVSDTVNESNAPAEKQSEEQSSGSSTDSTPSSSEESKEEAVSSSSSSSESSSGSESSSASSGSEVTSDSASSDVSSDSTIPESGSSSSSQGESVPSGSEQDPVQGDPSAEQAGPADGMPESETDEDASAEQANGGISTQAVSNEFEVTWESGRQSDTVTVQLYDENGGQFSANVRDFSLKSGESWQVDDQLKELVDEDGNTYNYQRAEYGYVGTILGKWTSQGDFQSVKATHSLWDGWSYQVNDGEDWTVGILNPPRTIRLYYTKEETSTGNVKIEDTIMTDGRLTAVYTDAEDGKKVTYEWKRNGTAVTPDSGDRYLANLDTETGKWVNVSLDVESLCYQLNDNSAKNNIRKTEYTYTVTAYVDGKYAGEAEYTVPYFAQLMNGSFEAPVNTDSEEYSDHPYQIQYSNSYDDNIDDVDKKLIWKSTGETKVTNGLQAGEWVAVEILNASDETFWDNGKLKTCSSVVADTHHCGQAADGVQYAEINCEAYGALYQNVLTVPGSTLNWNLSHLPREVSRNGKGDTMALVIVPASEGQTYMEKFDDASKKIDSSSAIREVLKEIEGKGDGYFVKEITDNKQWEENQKQWNDYSGTYKVGEGQYLTTFFFVAVDTGSDDKTVGNLIDDVWFSPELPEPDDDEVQLTITKTVEGLESVEDYAVNVSIEGSGVEKQTVTLNNFTSGSTGGTFTASETVTVKIPYQNSTILTIKETAPQTVNGYELSTTTYAVDNSTSGSGDSVQITVKGEEVRKITFTNTYEPPVEPKNLENDKYVEDNGDGTYDLSLNVSGAVSSDQTNNPIDVIFVLDTSTSMNYYMDGDSKADTFNKSRLYYATDAIGKLAESLDTADARFALIEFESSSRGITNFGGKFQSTYWTDSADAVKGKLDDNFVGFGRGTNYEDALDDAKGLLSGNNSVRENAKVVVVFVSDGDPTQYNTSWGEGGLGSEFDPTAMDKAQIVVSEMDGVDYFFTVGVGDADNYTQLSNLTNQADYPYYGYGQNRKQYELPAGMTVDNFNGENETELNAAFDEILTTISTNLTIAENITDYLSDNVEVVTVDGQFKQPIITVTQRGTETLITDADGGQIEGNGASDSITLPATDNNDEATLTAEYDSDARTVVLTFPQGYQLEPNYTYTVTVTIKATEAAYAAYRNNGNQYPDVSTTTSGDFTGGAAGVFTNKSATLTYDDGKTKDYPKPVIPLDPQTLTITKTVEGLDGLSDAEWTSYKNSLMFTVSNGNIRAAEINLSAFQQAESGYTFTATVTGLMPGTTYTVSENADKVTVPNYEFEQTKTTQSVTTLDWSAGDGAETPNAAFTNKYTKSVVDLTVDKTVLGSMGVSGDSFSFTLTLKDKNGEAVEDTDIKQGSEVKHYDKEDGLTFTLADGDTTTFEIPSGLKVTIKEAQTGGYRTYNRVENTGAQDDTVTLPENGSDEQYENILTEKYTNGPATESIVMDGNKTVHFINFRPVVAPTGLESNHTAPYALMVTAAGVAGLALLGSMAARRRRRQE